MLGNVERSILNVNLKKKSTQITHPVIDLKMELYVKTVNHFKFLQKDPY